MLFAVVRSLLFPIPTQTVRIMTFLASRIKKTDWTEGASFCLISSKRFNVSAKGFCEEKLEKRLFSLPVK